jgi:hypothetical protein
MQGHKDPSAFYDQVIAPYKGAIEEWYVDHQGVGTYIKVTLITVWVIIFPTSKVVWKAFPGLPLLPPALRDFKR